MNSRQNELFNNLVALTKNENEAFYKQEFKLDDSIYWIFNYRLASWSDFQLPDALNCRGTMFEVTSDGLSIRLASLPMSKFFNKDENPSVMNLDLSDVIDIAVKSDGSLMSTYMHNGQLRLKSKGSITSEQCIDAMKWLDLPENKSLKHLLSAEIESGYTVCLEWVAPWNRVVLGYDKPRLIFLCVMNDTHINYEECVGDLYSKWEEPRPILTGTYKEFIESIPDMTEDIEGFIFTMEDGQRVKVKTKKYLSLHHAKDSINNPRRLYECVLDEGSDDLKSMFATDQTALNLINDMEEFTKKTYNHMVAVVENFHNANKELDRKSYAIKGQAELDHIQFGLAMMLYVGKPAEYKETMKKRYKEFGIADIQKDKTR